MRRADAFMQNGLCKYKKKKKKITHVLFICVRSHQNCEELTFMAHIHFCFSIFFSRLALHYACLCLYYSYMLTSKANRFCWFFCFRFNVAYVCELISDSRQRTLTNQTYSPIYRDAQSLAIIKPNGSVFLRCVYSFYVPLRRNKLFGASKCV